MADIIKVSTEQLRSGASQFESEAGNLNNIISRIAEIASSIGSAWKGEASSSYTSKFSSLQQDGQVLYNRVKEHCTDLNEIAAQYDQAESAANEQAGGLPTGVIE